MRDRYLFLFRIALGAALFIGIIVWVGSEGIIARLSNLDWPWLILMPVLWIINLIAISIGLYALLGKGANLSVVDFFRCVFISSSLGAFLPLQIGESSLVLLLKQQGVPLTKSVSLFITDKIITLSVLWIFGSIGLYFIVYKHVAVLWVGLGTPAFLIIVAVIIIRLINAESGKLREYLQLKALRFVYDHTQILLKEMLSNRSGMAINAIFTAARMLLIQPVMYFICFKACGTHIPMASLILISNILTAVSLIPITAQGLGVVEISAVYLFSLIHVNESTTVAIYLISRPLYFIFSGLILLFTGGLWDMVHRRDRFYKNS